ncbi:MAG: phosphate ABC transporter substrate-binding protein PstS [Halothiobacillus sp. 24-54-40]|jgi:phosphate transport system substrate-binding protein|nr:MAG: phosphate ABC transporter substrate-binding protein PstS [Halothiobacillus sp. 35-54-62]OYZ86068.1 MAG: phosphate ABC transporter substrate-binding protein PstS [Halothiobacillus sp. 24-54-40]OZA79833.1 MAG: phosphate ABC transporter substrate-binding protein PstS [Halothiobacillus sp. 39-53-45]HQS03506.1 phosphate ABC transporter substrate-binding protein PstS [Halothiobacillus sp.]HQS29890.1 phosphate ABC transporter substrate-binding protein PstS [Halothiobacillus sp.]
MLKMNKTMRGTAVAVAAGAALLASGAAMAGTVSVLETGSSLLYPLFNLWQPVYTKANPNVQLTTASTGSGTGQAQSMQGLAQIGASDAYLSDAQMKQHPSMLNIPMAISSQMVNYNVPSLNGEHLNLSGPVLAGIYSGKITQWNDAAIAKLNPGVKLPDHAIITVHRTDGSGDTFIFTQYLTASTPSWASDYSYGVTVSWAPVQGNIGAVGNPGMVDAIKNNPYSIAYIGVSFKKQIMDDKLGEARLENKDGKFVLPEIKNVKAAAAAMVPKSPADQRVSLIFAPGAESYPIINYEYALVDAKQPSAEMAATLKKFLTWAISSEGGNAEHFMKEVNFVALPPSVVKQSEAQIAKISG